MPCCTEDDPIIRRVEHLILNRDLNDAGEVADWMIENCTAQERGIAMRILAMKPTLANFDSLRRLALLLTLTMGATQLERERTKQ